MKRPAFQFYPADWRKDAALQSCSLAARGLWHELLCIMHECEPYGRLSVNGRAMTGPQIARVTGVSVKECAKLLLELSEAGVFSVDGDCIYSRRMVKDEHLRNIRAEGGILGADHGKKGGRPRKPEGVLNKPLTQPLKDAENNPHSSSSSSSSSEGEERAQDFSESDEPDLLTEPQALAAAMTAGIPPDFAGMVFLDWHSRSGKDGTGTQVKFPSYAKKRWVRESAEWNSGEHRNLPKNGKNSKPDPLAGYKILPG